MRCDNASMQQCDNAITRGKGVRVECIFVSWYLPGWYLGSSGERGKVTRWLGSKIRKVPRLGSKLELV